MDWYYVVDNSYFLYEIGVNYLKLLAPDRIRSARVLLDLIAAIELAWLLKSFKTDFDLLEKVV